MISTYPYEELKLDDGASDAEHDATGTASAGLGFELPALEGQVHEAVARQTVHAQSARAKGDGLLLLVVLDVVHVLGRPGALVGEPVRDEWRLEPHHGVRQPVWTVRSTIGSRGRGRSNKTMLEYSLRVFCLISVHVKYYFQCGKNFQTLRITSINTPLYLYTYFVHTNRLGY